MIIILKNYGFYHPYYWLGLSKLKIFINGFNVCEHSHPYLRKVKTEIIVSKKSFLDAIKKLKEDLEVSYREEIRTIIKYDIFKRKEFKILYKDKLGFFENIQISLEYDHIIKELLVKAYFLNFGSNKELSVFKKKFTMDCENYYDFINYLKIFLENIE